MAGFGKRAPGDAPLEFRPQLKAANPALESAQKHSFPIIAGVVVLVAGIVAWNVIPSRTAAAASPAQIALEAHLDEHPGLERLHAVLEAEYPKAYKDVAKRSQAALKRGDLVAPTAIGHKAFQTLISGQAGHIPFANGSTLHAWSRATYALLVELQQTAPDTCGKIRPALAALNISEHPGVADKVSAFAAASLDAAYQGRIKPARHASPEQDDLMKLGLAAMNRGVTEADMVGLNTAADWDRLPGEKRCSLVVALFSSMQTLGEPTRSRVLSTLATRAAGPL